MRIHSMAPWLLATLLAGCADQSPTDPLPVVDPTSGGPKAENQALETDQIRQEYDACIRKLGPQNASCQELKWMYDDARQHFDAARRPSP
jgi:hypothetical protein